MPRPSPLTPQVQAAFLELLRGGMLVEAAAKRVGVAISSLYWRRKRDPLFGMAWEAAVELSVEWVEEAESGRRVRAPGCKRRLRFSEARRTAYLGRLERSCNVRWAARETGVDRSVVYRRLRRDPGFAGQSGAALRRGLDDLFRALEAKRAEREARLRSGELAARIEPKGEMTRDFDRQMLLLRRYERPDGTIGSRRVRRGFQRSMPFEAAILLLDRKMRGLGLVANRPLAERMEAAEAARRRGAEGG